MPTRRPRRPKLNRKLKKRGSSRREWSKGALLHAVALWTQSLPRAPQPHASISPACPVRETGSVCPSGRRHRLDILFASGEVELKSIAARLPHLMASYVLLRRSHRIAAVCCMMLCHMLCHMLLIDRNLHSFDEYSVGADQRWRSTIFKESCRCFRRCKASLRDPCPTCASTCRGKQSIRGKQL